MKRKIQCYLAFTPRLYRVLLFIAVPVLAMLFSALQVLLFAGGGMNGMCALALLIACAEVLVDALAFGGIASREAGGMEYLKSSAKGNDILSTALRVNLVRQLLEQILVLLACKGIDSACRGTQLFERGELSAFLAVVLLGYFMTVLGVAIARFFTNMLFITFVPCFEIVPFWGIVWVMMRNYAVAAVLLVVLSAAAGIGGIWFVQKRRKESYYDKTA